MPDTQRHGRPPTRSAYAFPCDRDGGRAMMPEQMKRLYLEHRALEEARDLDGVIDTFDDDCFLENVALGTRALGRDGVRRGYESLLRRVSRPVTRIGR